MKFKILTACATLLPASAFSDSIDEDLIGKAFSANEKYSCTAEELDTYIAAATRPLFIPLPVTSPDDHVQNIMAKKQIEGDGDSCISLAMDTSIFERLQSLIEKLENLSIDVPPNILDALMSSLMKRMKELYDGLCNVFTQEFAQKKVEDFIDSKSEVSVKDLKKMDTAANRQSMLQKAGQDKMEDDLKKRGLDKRWASKDEWGNIAYDNAKDKVNDVADDLLGM